MPDIALFPQPGILKDFVKQGKMTDLSTQLDVNKLKSDLVPGVLDAGEVDGKYYGVPVSMNVKSLVFYPKKAWAARATRSRRRMPGAHRPHQQDQGGRHPAVVHGDRVRVGDGLGGHRLARGQPARGGRADTYDKWVNHQIPFNDPAVKKAAQDFESLVLADGNVLGGRKQTVSTAYASSANPMFDNPPKCFLHRQGNFITQAGFFPAKVVADIDNQVGVFQYPGQTADSKPMLGGGDLAAVFNGKDDDTKQVMAFLTGKDYPGWSEKAGFLSPRKDYPLTNYKSKLTQQIAQLGQQSTVFRFDGSDQMPGAVGSGSFWKGMVAWVSGQKDLDTALKDIESSWPS